MKIDISVENINMIFRLYNDEVKGFKEYVLKSITRNISYSDFYALNSVSFKIYSGERVGIIGRNGAGKSTLLKIISGVITPTSGKVTINGNIAPLLELGAGFDPELSGAENIYLNGAILGKTKQYLDSKYEEIVGFSGLGKFINTPVKNYSSGMKARLGFAIATQIDPDILIVDEILGVGDQEFKKKSTNRIKELFKQGKTVLLVSHQLSQIREFADKVIWLENGTVKEIGATKQVCDHYESSLSNK